MQGIKVMVAEEMSEAFATGRLRRQHKIHKGTKVRNRMSYHFHD